MSLSVDEITDLRRRKCWFNRLVILGWGKNVSCARGRNKFVGECLHNCTSPTHAILLHAPHECSKARKEDGIGRNRLFLESCHLTKSPCAEKGGIERPLGTKVGTNYFTVEETEKGVQRTGGSDWSGQ